MNIDLSQHVMEMPDDTPIYKYMSRDVFFNHFFKNRGTIQFQQVSNWKDGQEGLLKEFIDKCQGEDRNIKYLGCCFTLEQDMSCALDSSLYAAENDELAEFGSDAMWQIYCPDGGVRVKTTIGKIRSAIGSCDEGIKLIKNGKVFYLPNSLPSSYSISNVDNNSLFIKRVNFRHEVEYRFILEKKGGEKFFLPVDPFEMVDEFLISPADTEDTKILAKCMYRNITAEVEKEVGYKFSVGEVESKPPVRISQLYGCVSQEV